ncbi:hypothetical protein OESDEN_02419 [Oesophagostomum dentatum]|uniref:Uncharacterized protein n=1 Tax=Oesophagostomum dentatum TaxID=61180 RepID=A0A0B1TJ83_OESDE|nr:hypothetical protein OESDEN_02419 [Oesophagostomum dentatum]
MDDCQCAAAENKHDRFELQWLRTSDKANGKPQREAETTPTVEGRLDATNDVALIDLTIEKPRPQFQLIRANFCTLYAASRMLFATKVTSPAVWDTICDVPEKDDDDEALVTD